MDRGASWRALANSTQESAVGGRGGGVRTLWYALWERAAERYSGAWVISRGHDAVAARRWARCQRSMAAILGHVVGKAVRA